ncbi:MAG: hypothetical protein IJH11_07915 [Lachnospiraceae bacterium]|nr:hypothetical protein [Lachnospiraceae bacterium]
MKKRKKRNKILLTILLVLALGVIGLGIGRMAGRLVGVRPAGSEGQENQGLGSSGMGNQGQAIQGQGSTGQKDGINGDAEMSGMSDLSSAEAPSTTEDAMQKEEQAKDVTKTPTPSPKPTSTPTPTPMPTRESLNDISVQDMSAYLGEMPLDGTDIVGTDTVDYTYEEVAKDLYFLTVRYPDLVKVRVCGESVDKRAIYEVVLGNEASENHIEIHYAMHSREYINTLLAMRQIEEFAKNAAGGGTYNGASIRDLFANVCIHILPMANPDGEMVAMGGLETLRLQSLRDIVHWCWESDTLLGRTSADLDTYLRTFKANAHGCDLNKNFDAGWAEYSDGVPVPSTDCYKGTGVASEPETQAILKVAHENPTRCVIAYHSAGNMIYWNYEVEDELLLNADRDLAAGLSEMTGYATAVAAKYNTHLAGGCSDYFMWTAGIPAVTVETGQGTCPLTIYEFPAIWESNKNVLYKLAEMYGG